MPPRCLCPVIGPLPLSRLNVKKVTLSDPGWTDIGATNGVVTTLLEGLGYDTQIYLLGVPVGFESLKNGEIDAFMGNWMPAQKGLSKSIKMILMLCVLI
ncbi:glycine betaine ABC transporter substrate-binding protein [Vibrio olivae]